MSGLPLYELTTPANVADSTVVQEILAATNDTCPFRECTFLGDKGYDVKAVYGSGERHLGGRSCYFAEQMQYKESR